MLATSKESQNNLINILVDRKVLDPSEVSKTKSELKENNQLDKISLIDALLNKNIISEDKILQILVKEHSFSVVNLHDIQISDETHEILQLLPYGYLEYYFIAPFKLENDILHIAISDSSKLRLMRNLKTITKKDIELHATKISDIKHFLEKAKQENPELANKESKVKTFDSQWADAGELLEDAPEPEDFEEIENESEVIKFSTAVVAEAIKLGVSDIHIESFRFSSRVRYRLDGMLIEQEKFSRFLHDNYNAVVTRFKIMGKLDIAERRIPQDGAIPFKIDGKVVDLRLSMLPTATNERIVMRILNKDAGDVSLEQLNFEPRDLESLRKAINGTQGLILVTGPTGSGKTTTLYSILKEISKPHLNILTAEDPVEYELDGIGQVAIRDDIGLSFSTALRSFLRQDPEIILVGEMRDKETVDIGLKAALTGHLVFSTLHTNDAPSTITRLQNMGTPDYLISAACTLVLAQRLVRKNCAECRVADSEVTPKLLTSIGFTAEQASRAKPSKGTGCEKCKKSGFKGRMGIYELLVVTTTIKEAILRKATTPELKEIAIKEGFRTMQDMGRQMILAGDLNFREYERVLSV